MESPAPSLLRAFFSWMDPPPAADPAPDVRSMPALGTTLCGRYRLDSEIGAGAAAVVFAATELRSGSPVAVKIANPNGIGIGDDARRDGVDLRHESEVAMRMAHPGILQVFEYVVDEPWEMLVMERGAGVDLSTLLKTAGRLGLRETASIGVQMLSALEHVHHRGMVHNDVKPANTLYDGKTARLFDFGAAVGVGAGLGAIAGSVAYMAPERFQDRPAEPRSDLYSLGCTLYAVCQGAPPFGRATYRAVRGHLRSPPPRVPGPLGVVLARAMAKEPCDRYSRAAEMRRALVDAMDLLDVRLTRRVTLTPAVGA